MGQRSTIRGYNAHSVQMTNFYDEINLLGPLAALIIVAAATGTAALTAILLPVLRRYTVAGPNARSSHKIPTPQGGGIAVIIATMATIIVVTAVSPTFNAGTSFGWIFVAVSALTILGAIDDVAGLAAPPRLLFQVVAVGIVVAVLPANLHLLPMLPRWVERAVLVVGGLWFVNVVNFMDGIDWISVAEVVPISAGLAFLGLFGALPPQGMLAALALCGAMIGFAPFNRPVARLFLGDAGSLPIGLLLVWLLILVAGNGHLAAALLLPLYYLADATVTLIRRLVKGELLMSAHRMHYYQQAFDGGYTVLQIVAHVFVLNLALIALAVATIIYPSNMGQIIALAIGGVLVVALLAKFSSEASKSRS
jgi:UDP-N-acetylmuramyl pentapeptide phosphotransferase/UDP-N-acetylglucosamine-1-phosphate transferase